MKTFKKILVILGIVMIILILAAYLLPRHYKIERTGYINSSPEIIFDLAGHLNKWDLWSTWTKAMDSTVVFTLNGPDGREGSFRSWKAEKLGNGRITIIKVTPREAFAYELSMEDGDFVSQGEILLQPAGDSVKVTWIHEGDLGYNPLSRYVGLFMNSLMGSDFETGLANLKRIAEERKNWPVIETIIMPEQVVLLIRDSAGPADYSKVMGRAFGELMECVNKEKLVCKSPPFAIYVKWDSVTYFSVMDLGIRVEKAGKGTGRIRIETIPPMEVAIAHYFGPYEKTAPTYYLLDQYIRESGKQQAGGPWEIYITDPAMVRDTAMWQTDILFPIR